MTTCPPDDRLRSLLDGQLSESEQAELQQHIDSCERCQQTLEGLVAGKESWDGIARRLGDRDTPITPALHDAIAAAKEMEATIPSVKLPPGLLQPSAQTDSMGRLAHYEVLQEVGSGGMGIVLKAFDTSLRRVVAIKVMAPHLAANAAARRRFVREAQAAAAVAHEHVVAIHAVTDQHEPPYLAMQFIEGKTLQERLDKDGPLSVREVLRIGMQTAAGLAAAHAQGLVHRDVKPANILLENGVERVKLTDFGLARAVDDASVTQSGVIAGTPLFMSPEQARGEAVDHRSDLFSLGSVMYAMCVGHSPFRASTTMGVIKRVCDDLPRPIREVNPDVPDWLNDIIAKLLAKAPADRFQTAAEVAELLEQCLAHVQQPSVVARPSGVVAPVEKASVKSTHAASSSTERVPFLFSPMSALPVHPMFGAIFWFGLTMLMISLGLAALDQLNVFSASAAAPLSGPFMLLVGIGSVSLVLMVAIQAISKRDWRATSLGTRPALPVLVFVGLIVIERLMFATWGGNGSAAQHRDPTMEFTRAIPTVMLLVIAAGLLLTGVVVGIRRFIRGLDTKSPGGRLWGTALSGLLLASLSTGLLAVGSFVAVFCWRSYVGPPIAVAFLQLEVGPRTEVTLNGEKVTVPDNQEVFLNLVPGEYVITTIKNGQEVMRSGEVMHRGQHKTMDEPQADAIRISGPMVMAYGPGSSAPNVNDYITTQGRYAYRQAEMTADPAELTMNWDMTRKGESPAAAGAVAASGIVWGPTSLKGVQLGIQFDPSRDEYRAGDVIKLRLFLRNAGKTALSTTLPRLEVLEKFGLDLSLLDDQDKPLTWTWGKAHKPRELFTVSGAMALPLRSGAIHELPAAEIVIGKEVSSQTAIAVLDVEPGQTCRFSCKLGTYGYAKDEGEPLASGRIEFKVAAPPEANESKPKQPDAPARD